MAVRKKHKKFQAVLTQFGYEHKKLDRQLAKIRKNANELAKALDTLDKNEKRVKR